MSLSEIQKEVDEWINQFKIGYWTPHEIYLRLGEESGELARVINRIYGPKPKKSDEEVHNLEEEIGDIIFTLCCLANSQNIKLDECFRMALDKAYKRDNKRFEKK